MRLDMEPPNSVGESLVSVPSIRSTKVTKFSHASKTQPRADLSSQRMIGTANDLGTKDFGAVGPSKWTGD